MRMAGLSLPYRPSTSFTSGNGLAARSSSRSTGSSFQAMSVSRRVALSPISSTPKVYGSMKSVELVTWPSAPSLPASRLATMVVGHW